jgi:hypothetical protein
MAIPPVHGTVRFNVVVPPNETGPSGNRANNGFLSLSGVAGSGIAPNNGLGDRRNGSAPLGGKASPVHPPNHRFDVGMAKMPQPPSAIEPGRGAIPINPWNGSGQPNHALRQVDLPKPPHQ